MRKTTGYILTYTLLILIAAISIPKFVRSSSPTGTNAIYLPTIHTPREFEANPTSTMFTNVTDIANAGDERLFITERSGLVHVMQEDGTKSVFLDIRNRVDTNGSEVGMFAIAFHPDYATNGYFYVSYTSKKTDTTWELRLAQFSVTADPNVANPNSESTILKVTMVDQKHNGGGLEFNPVDGNLYLGIGDDGSGFNAQEAASYKGRLAQVNFNPVQVAQNRSAEMVQLSEDTFAAQGINVTRWTKGLRNPWRIAVDPVNGRIFVGDVGDLTWEEINLIPLGGKDYNFGWPCREGPVAVLTFDSCNRFFNEPIYYYSNGCAITMGDVYRPNNDPSYEPEVIFADGCTGKISGLRRTNTGWIAEEIGGIPEEPFHFLATFGIDNTGTLYAGVLGSPVPLYELYIPPHSTR